MRNLFIIGILLVGASMAGWFQINREGDRTTIEINRSEIRADARQAIDRGRDFLDRREGQYADQTQQPFDQQQSVDQQQPFDQQQFDQQRQVWPQEQVAQQQVSYRSYQGSQQQYPATQQETGYYAPQNQSGNQQYPAPNQTYPAQNQTYPAQNYPAQNQYPAQSQQYPLPEQQFQPRR